MKRLDKYSVIQLNQNDLLDINGGNQLPKNWDQMSFAQKSGYVIGHATFAAVDLAAALLLPWV
ncbi:MULTISPECIES: hypothetical protein [unclassified Pedobacter]|uniref:hypothetical protein n=1 Tax=unclassified Pedobacter TaxID=2628915 RepID=UPI000B4B7A8B|nr:MULTISPECIES: hypothetical protein [unclassified Pedobacter]MCX2432651.1 hypothetical protein [Pedobacter sp. GR22-10]OWK70108.1 hypothetical protein CBW18_14105 [Pedobacter sp. AJM]